MKKWTTLEEALTPDGKPISLHEHDGSYTIKVDGIPLMSTRQHQSEERLAQLACADLRGTRGASVLIGGLGFGFTLRAALSALAADARVLVAELAGEVIAWNRNASLPLSSDALADARVAVVQRDVAEVIREAGAAFDAIVLDVDNGPDALSAGSNSRLYDAAGLHHARVALKPGGCAAFWSVAPDAAFETRLAQAGFTVVTERCRAHGKSGRWHTLFIGRRHK
jgi:spermidine synthase